MNNQSFIILFVVLLGLFSSSFQQQQDPQQFVDYIETEAKSVTFGAGVDGLSIDVSYGEQGEVESLSIELIELSTRDPNEWTFEVVTQDGEVYTFVDDNGYLGVLGPNGLDVDVSHSYAEWAGVEDQDSADRFGEWVVETVDYIYEAAELEQVD